MHNVLLCCGADESLSVA